YTDHVFSLGAPVAAGTTIDVVFGNDATISGQDRNLYVDSVKVNGATLRPTDAGVTVDIGSGAAAFDGVNVVPGRSDILWNAALRFKAPESLIVRARGSSAAGVPPTMQVLVDGVAVGSVDVKSSAYADYAFALKTAPNQRVDIVFPNNGEAGSEDRNLYVDAVIFGGRTLRPGDSGALVDIGSGAAAFDGVNVIPGQGAILWNAALRLPVSASAATAGRDLLASASVSGTSVPSGAIDIRTTGAKCDGSFDNSSAIASAIASAKSKRVAVYVPAGVCAYGDVIRLDSVKLVGAGDTSVLYALNPNRESIYMYGNGAEVSLLKLSGRQAAARQAAWEATRITLFGASNFVIDKVAIDGSAAAGIQTAQATNNGRITNNSIKDTLADSIHMTDKASYITLENNRIENSGDDGIAVVSYRNDGGMVNHITARNNVILNNKWGRQMSVVGGSQVLYENNRVESNLAGRACLYIAQEASYSTYGAHDVTARYNTLKTCGGSSTGHGAVMVFSDGQEANTNVALTRNDIVQNGAAGIRVFSAQNTGVRLDSNRVQGANPALDVTSPGVTVIPYSSGVVGYTAP
ncbi:MAG TPA: carbohydrate-binding domain-containing protein, partial [Burkholderiaceae bacterium]|nr:carbohydrate-binding domain-containing protein [Burkholderiaceae bacterium]